MYSSVMAAKIQSRAYQNATTAWDEASSVPATTVLVSWLQATDNTGTFRSTYNTKMSCQQATECICIKSNSNSRGHPASSRGLSPNSESPSG